MKVTWRAGKRDWAWATAVLGGLAAACSTPGSDAVGESAIAAVAAGANVRIQTAPGSLGSRGFDEPCVNDMECNPGLVCIQTPNDGGRCLHCVLTPNGTGGFTSEPYCTGGQVCQETEQPNGESYMMCGTPPGVGGVDPGGAGYHLGDLPPSISCLYFEPFGPNWATMNNSCPAHLVCTSGNVCGACTPNSLAAPNADTCSVGTFRGAGSVCNLTPQGYRCEGPSPLGL